MCNVSDILKCILFADDTNLFYTGKNIDKMCNIISIELNKLDMWFKVNKLSLNLQKTNYMFFSSKRAKNDLRIAIDNFPIEKVESTKFLGVYIDNKLNWQDHIKHVRRKAALGLSVLYKVRNIVNTSALFSLYCTIILPHLMYCCETWGNNYRERIKPLLTIQKKAIRILGGAHYRDHTQPIFYQFGLLNLYDIIDLQTLCFMYKVKNQILPRNLQHFFNLTYDMHTYNTRQLANFSIKFCRTTLKSFCLSIHGPKLWNSLPDKLKSISSLKSFKKCYKLYLINEYH
jgi:hypothetical protein